MNYEKKYKEALERARKLYNEAKTLDYTQDMEDYETIFPELQESEDERIRKEIFHFVLENTLTTDMRQHRWLAWLEKQGLSTFDKCRQEGDRIVENPDGTHFNISQLERVAKVEPKFKVGDFIVNDYCFGKVIEITNDAYLLDTGQGIPFSCEHNAHLWTIQDAKDGDILVSKRNQPFIYNGIFNEESVGAYCGIGCLGAILLESNHPCNWSYKEGVKPATKEQRDLLFAKIKDAGFEWDEGKKELRKINENKN